MLGKNSQKLKFGNNVKNLELSSHIIIIYYYIIVSGFVCSQVLTSIQLLAKSWIRKMYREKTTRENRFHNYVPLSYRVHRKCNKRLSIIGIQKSWKYVGQSYYVTLISDLNGSKLAALAIRRASSVYFCIAGISLLLITYHIHIWYRFRSILLLLPGVRSISTPTVIASFLRISPLYSQLSNKSPLTSLAGCVRWTCNGNNKCNYNKMQQWDWMSR